MLLLIVIGNYIKQCWEFPLQRNAHTAFREYRFTLSKVQFSDTQNIRTGVNQNSVVISTHAFSSLGVGGWAGGVGGL